MADMTDPVEYHMRDDRFVLVIPASAASRLSDEALREMCDYIRLWLSEIRTRQTPTTN